MATSLFDMNSDPFAVLGQDSSVSRKELAQYAIAQAAGYMQNNQNDQAIGAFKKALALDPQSATAYTYMGNIYLSQGKNGEAIKAYQQAVRIQSNNALVDTATSAPTQVEARISLGNAYLQDKQYAASEKEFKIAEALDPKSSIAAYTLGLQYANTDRLSEAEAQFRKVQKIAPNDGNVYYALGMVNNKQGRYEEAVTNLEKALSLKKSFPAANYELGAAYDALGRTEDAQKQLAILSTTDATQYQNLKTLLEKPGISYMDTKKSGGFSDYLGPGVPLWMLDPTLLTQPRSTKTFSITIGFNTAMDPASVNNTQNWSIARADGGDGGFYNNTMPLSSKDVALPSNPLSVYYNPTTREATLTFSLTQNANGDAVIDQKHIVFKFSGKDALGRTMDTTANQIDGESVDAY